MKTKIAVYFGQPATVTIAMWENSDHLGVPAFCTERGVTHVVFEEDEIIIKYDLLDSAYSSKEMRYPADASTIACVYR